MKLYYYYLLILWLILFIVFRDPNVPAYIKLRYQLTRINFIRFFMKVKLKYQLDKDYRQMQKALKRRLKENEAKEP